MTDTGQPRLVVRALAPGDLGWVVERHGFRYAAEYDWNATFEDAVARIVAGFVERTDERESGWIAEIDGQRVGCVFCTAADAKSTAQLRLLLVEPSARGRGWGAGWSMSVCGSLPSAATPGSRCGPKRASAGPAHLPTLGIRTRSARTPPQFRARPDRRTLVAGPWLALTGV